MLRLSLQFSSTYKAGCKSSPGSLVGTAQDLVLTENSDMWSVEDSVAFFAETLEVDAELGMAGIVCHETHRNRSCFNPAVTADIIARVPR